jgi:hypothetical protein
MYIITYVISYVYIRDGELKVKLSGAADRRGHRDTGIRIMAVNRFKFHRAPASAGGSRATTQDFPNRCTQRNTTGVSRYLWRERAAPTQDHIKAV